MMLTAFPPESASSTPAQSAAAASFAGLVDKMDYLSAAEVEMVRQAYRFADAAHLGQMRKNGDPYITHPIAVAAQCAEWKLDAQALMAALMHDAMEDCGVSKVELVERFGLREQITITSSSREVLKAARELTPQEVAQRIHIPGVLGAMVVFAFTVERAGRLVRNRAGLLLIAARANLLSGQVQGHRDGFGFLIRDDSAQDLVLSEHEMSKVLHGDRALVRVTGIDRKGRPEGSIVEVTERANTRVIGRVFVEHGVVVVVPENRRLSHDILVPAELLNKVTNDCGRTLS